MDKVKIGILGLGQHCSKSHLNYLLENSNVEVAGAFDTNTTVHQPYLFRFKAEDQLLNDPSINAVLIMTPDIFHAKSAFNALIAGKHVLCEKPCAANATHLHTFMDALEVAKEKNLVFSSCHPRRMDTPFVWLKNFIESNKVTGEFGNVLDFGFDFSYHKPPQKDLHEGLLMDHFNHEIDLLNWYFGHSTFEAFKLNDSKTRYMAVGQRSDGISFSFSGTRMLETKKYMEFIRVKFQKGSLELDTHNGTVKTFFHDQNAECKEICGPTDYALRFKAVNDNFVNAILGKEKSYLTLDDLEINTLSGIRLSSEGHFSNIKDENKFVTE